MEESKKRRLIDMTLDAFEEIIKTRQISANTIQPILAEILLDKTVGLSRDMSTLCGKVLKMTAEMLTKDSPDANLARDIVLALINEYSTKGRYIIMDLNGRQAGLMSALSVEGIDVSVRAKLQSMLDSLGREKEIWQHDTDRICALLKLIPEATRQTRVHLTVEDDDPELVEALRLSLVELDDQAREA
jgi:hypothetical protein